MDTYNKRVALFNHFMRLYHDDLKRYISSMTVNINDRDEVLQNTLEKIFKNIDRVKDYSKTKSYFLKIAKNEKRKYYNKRNKLDHYEILYEGSDRVTIEQIEDVLSSLLNVDLNLYFSKIINQLEPKYRQIILLHYYYEYSLAKIASMLDINYNTVLSRHSRALKKLKKICDKVKMEE